METKRNRKMIGGGFIFLGVGLFGLILPFISFGVSDDYEILQAIAEEQVKSGLQDQFIKETSAGYNSAPIPTNRPDPNRTDIKDRLVISGIKIDMPIYESDSANVLLKGGWVFPGTARPGEKGNSVIFAHRFRYLPPVTNTFYSLDKVNVGDTFIVSWKGQVFTYKIKDKKIIEPTDFSVLEQGLGSEMTLITCAPLFSTKQRLVVIGTLIPAK